MQATPDFFTVIKHPSAWLPLLLSLAALLLLVFYVLAFGSQGNTSGDEGLAAHLFQLLLLAEVPLVLWFLLRWLRATPRISLLILLLQAVFWLAPVVTIFMLEN